MVSTHPLIYKSSSHCINPFVTVPRAPITTGITVTFMFHSFVNSLIRTRYLSFFSLSFNSTLWLAETVKSTILQVLSFLLIIIRSGRLAEIRRSVCISKYQRSLSISFSMKDCGLCIYHLFVWSHFNFFHNSHWIILPTQSCLVLYSFCINLQHSLMWLMVWSLSPHDLNLLFSVYYYYLLIRVFHISVSWWSFTGDWVTASLLKSPGLFSVFWPLKHFLIIYSFSFVFNKGVSVCNYRFFVRW